ncbi:MAG: hypothetical protein ACOVNU_04005 [Candidatus Kapaibacteriota bacterium]
MAKHTLEEAADLWSIDTNNVHPDDSYIAKKSFIEGAKWQEEQDKKCYHPLPYRLAKSDSNFECTLCGKFI